MWAIALKEFRQLRRDRRTVAMLFLLPFLFLIVFGYAASFDVKEVPTLVAGPHAALVAAALPSGLHVIAIRPGDTAAQAREALRRGEAVVAVVLPATPGAAPQLLIDGTELFAAQAALRALAQAQAAAGGGAGAASGSAAGGAGASAQTSGTTGSAATGSAGNAAPGLTGNAAPGLTGNAATGAVSSAVLAVRAQVLFNPDLRTAVIMIPGLCGIILVFVGTVATALGVVRERQAGTLEQLAVMPFRPRDVFLGKIAPYLVIAALDMVIVVGAGMLLFNVPFRGSVAVFALGAALFLFTTLGIGVLISTVSQTQGQAIQLAIMTLLPQFLLSGLFFPLYSIAWGVRWLGYLLPLTYFIKVARGVMVRGAPLGALWVPMVVLAAMATVVFTASTLRFRRDLAPAGGGRGEEDPGAPDPSGESGTNAPAPRAEAETAAGAGSHEAAAESGAGSRAGMEAEATSAGAVEAGGAGSHADTEAGP